LKHWLVVLTVVGVVCAGWGQESSSKSVTVIRAGTLIDGSSNSSRRNQVIVIRGNQIAEVADAASVHIPDGAEIIDLSQATVLPG